MIKREKRIYFEAYSKNSVSSHEQLKHHFGRYFDNLKMIKGLQWTGINWRGTRFSTTKKFYNEHKNLFKDTKYLDFYKK